MQIPPTTALLHALSRVGEHSPTQPRPTTPRADGAVVPDAARAAAKAAFQALRQVPPASVNAPPPAVAAPQSTAKQMPRGTFLNLLV